jgi:hypothetical protein
MHGTAAASNRSATDKKGLYGPFLFSLNNNMNQLNTNTEIIDDDIPEHNPDQFRSDRGGLVTKDNGIADRLLQNDRLYNSLKGDWQRTDYNLSKNIRTTTGREDGKFYIKREQLNVEYIADQCAEYRKRAEAGWLDPLAPIGEDGKLTWKWMDLPEAVAHQIGNDYFGGLSWHTIKRDRSLKAQFYKVVEKEYSAFVCYPGGKLPIPIDVPYPAKVGQKAFFEGANFAGKQ